MEKLKCASFFAGVGGIDMGFEQSGKFETVYANEIDSYPVETYELNFPLKVDHRSITDVQPDEIPDFDVMLAGFPCTDISVAGYQKGLFNEDGSYTRSGLFFELIRIAHIKKPRIIFLENVKNLVGHNGGKTFRIIYRRHDDWFILVEASSLEYGNISMALVRKLVEDFTVSEKPLKFWTS